MVRLYLSQTAFSLGISSLSFVFLILSGLQANGLNHQVEELKRRLSSLKQLAIRSQESAAFLKTHEQDFRAFEGCGFERPLTPVILQGSLPYPVEFTSPASSGHDRGYPGLIFQDIAFSILCLQDRHVFAFMEQLLTQGPGLFQIHDVTIHRLGPFRKEMLEKIAAGQPRALFEARIRATWIHR